jgi:hypothetical protein
VPSSIRVRDNQRRSRTRRAELLNDLQKRVHEYERQGVAATQEMQRAARKVAQDNVRLRSLLALHSVSREEIESFLQLPNEASSLEAHLLTFQESSVTRPCGTSQREVNDNPSPAESSTQGQSQYFSDGHTDVGPQFAPDRQGHFTLRHSEIAESFIRTLATEQVLREATEQREDMPDRNKGSSNSIEARPTTEPPECPSSLSCFCPPAPAPTIGIHRVNSGLEISCETAATIIAEMRGDGDRESVRASLGCIDQGDCNIKNSTVLQIMDQR